MLAGAPVWELPPNRLEELAGWLGNQGMNALLEAGAEWFLVPASSRSASERPRLRLWTQALAAAGYLLLRLVML